jgi:hypothetical protein
MLPVLLVALGPGLALPCRADTGAVGSPGISPAGARSRGFASGLGWSGIIAAPQIALVGVPFFRITEIDPDAPREHPGSESIDRAVGTFTGVMITAGAASALGAGIFLVLDNRLPGEPGPLQRRAYHAGFVKGMGLGLLAVGALDALIGALMLQGTEHGIRAGYGSDTAGKVVSYAMIGAGGAQVLAGAVMALWGHHRAATLLQRASLSPTWSPGGAGALLTLRF